MIASQKVIDSPIPERKRTKRRITTMDVSKTLDLEDDASSKFDSSWYTTGGATKNTAIPVENYNEDKELNFAIMASLQLYHYPNEEDIIILDDPQILKRSRRSITETGEPSNSKNSFTCEICVEDRECSDSFPVNGCSHAYCIDCITKYVESRLEENVTSICCPAQDCDGSLSPEHCSSILPPEVFDQWGKALCESFVLGFERSYCPYNNCNAVLIDDGDEDVRESVCPNCWRLFCAKCKVPWHSDISCEKFQKLHKDEREKEDIMLMNLANSKEWRRCPRCKIYVERTHGCRYIKCRCGTAFCYGCGTTSINVQTHYCPNCKM